MKALLRRLFRLIIHRYPKEYGKHSILTRIYFPLLAPRGGTQQTVTLYNGLRIHIHPDEYLQAFLYNFGGYEFPTLRFFERFLNEGDAVLDIGAQIGFMSIVFAKCVGTSGKVFAFEPEQANYDLLIGNISLNGFANIEPFHVAIADVRGTLNLFLGKGENTGVHSTVFNDRTQQSQSIQVPAIPIDELVVERNIPKVALVKIDIEGAELKALRGMRALLERDKPVMLIELSAELQNLSGISIRTFKSVLLEEFGYEAFTLTEQGTLRPTPTSAFHLNDNVVFIHASVTSSVPAQLFA